MAKASMSGLMAHVTKASLQRERDKDKVVGNQQKIMATSISEPIKTIRKMDMDVMFG